MKQELLKLGVVLGLLSGPMVSQAAVLINVAQVGSDVVFTSSGTLDLSGAQFLNSYLYWDTGITPGGNYWYYAQGTGFNVVNGYRLSSSAGPFGTNTSYSRPTTNTVTNFGIVNNLSGGPQLIISSTFESGSSVSGGMTFSGQTFTTLGLTPGTYDYSLPNDKVTLIIAGQSVPVPATIALLGLGLVGIGAARRKQA
jgi:hypothetical protein